MFVCPLFGIPFENSLRILKYNGNWANDFIN